MKTCSKCKATGIPDDAKFCPVCGKPINVGDSPWYEKSKELQKKRMYLLDISQALKLFSEDRNKLITRLSQDASYVSQMRESATIIQQNKENQQYKGNAPQEKLPNFLKILLIIVCFIIPPIGIIAIIVIVHKQNSSSNMHNTQSKNYTNEYTNTYLSPFINANINSYYLVLESKIKTLTTTQQYTISDITSKMALEFEICDSEGVSKALNTKLEEIDNRIKEIDQQIETIKSLQQ